MKKIFLLLLIVTLLYSPIKGEVSLDYKGSALWSGIQKMELEGDYLYSAFHFGLGVYNITDRESPELVGKTYLQGDTRKVIVNGDYAYLASGKGGLGIVDISTPSSPTLVGSLSTRGEIISVVYKDNYIFALSSHRGITVIDVSEPSAPSEVSDISLSGGAFEADIEGDYLYVVRGIYGLTVFDISDPTSPVEVGNVSSTTVFEEVKVAEGYAYVAASTGGLKIVDVSTPSSPSIVEDYTSPGTSVYGVEIFRHYAFLECGNKGAIVLDVLDPTSPSKIDIFPVSTFLYEFETGIDYAYISVEKGLQILDITEPSSVSLLNTVLLTSGYENIELHNDYAYVLAGYDGLRMVDVSSPTNPTFASKFILTVSFDNIGFKDDWAFIAGGNNGMQVINVSTPESFEYDTAFSTGGYNSDLTIQRTKAFLAVRDTGLMVVNIYDPPDPRRLEVYNTPAAKNITSDSQYVYLIDDTDGLKIFDIVSLELLGENFTSCHSNDIKLLDNHLYVASEREELIIFDVSSPSSPTIDSRIELDDAAKGIGAEGNRLYVAVSEEGIKIFDISEDPGSPVELGSVNFANDVNDVAVKDSTVYLAQKFGMTIFYYEPADVKEKGTPLSLNNNLKVSVSPNPFSNSTNINIAPQSEILTARSTITDLKGNIIKNFGKVPLKGHCNLQWNGENNQGEPVSSGVYIFHIKGKKINFSRKLNFIK